MQTEKTLAAMLADLTHAQDILATSWQTPGGPWAPGHARAWCGLEYIRAKLTEELRAQGADHAASI